jgi:hypothetical protein
MYMNSRFSEQHDSIVSSKALNFAELQRCLRLLLDDPERVEMAAVLLQLVDRGLVKAVTHPVFGQAFACYGGNRMEIDTLASTIPNWVQRGLVELCAGGCLWFRPCHGENNIDWFLSPDEMRRKLV